MSDEENKVMKSILWTTFIPVNVKTGKREIHPPEFMEFAKSVENTGIDFTGGIRGRELNWKEDRVGLNS